MKTNWKMIVIVAVVAVVGLSVVAIASGAAKVKNPFRGRAACGQLMSNPEAVKAMQALRDEHRGEMQAWYGKHADPTSAEAKAALKSLRQEHWNDMKALFKEFGIKVPKGVGPGVCGGQGGMTGGRGNGPCGSSGGAGCAGSGSGAGNQGSGYDGGMMGGGRMMGGASY